MNLPVWLWAATIIGLAVMIGVDFYLVARNPRDPSLRECIAWVGFYVLAPVGFGSVMGLRQLFFLIGNLLDRLVYLSNGLAFILAFIGVKLVLAVASLIKSRRDRLRQPPAATVGVGAGAPGTPDAVAADRDAI